MSNLLGLLNLGSSAFLAQNSGLATSAKNIANINTEGYSRQTVDFKAEDAAHGPGGVRALSAQRAESPLLSARERTSAGNGGRAGATAQATLGLEADLIGGGDVSASVADFFASVGRLASAPLDDTLRRNLLDRAGELGTQFQNAASAITAARSDSGARISDAASQASSLAAQIASLNKILSTFPDPALADERELAARKLAEIMGGRARVDDDGKMRFVAAGGVVLVDGDRAAKIETQPDPANPLSSRVVVKDGTHTEDVTLRLDSGRIAGELAFRDGTAVKAAAALDDLAYDLATGVNAVHQNGVGLDGSTGRNLFTPPGARAGAAAAFSVDAAIAADPRRLAAAATGEGNGGAANAQAILALRDAPLAGGGTRSFADEAIKTVADVGAAARVADHERSRETARAEGVAAARDALSGVSQEEEMARMVAFQRAAQGALQVVATVNDLMGDLFARI